ncbi:uncharacterized protein K444DRAFT_606053 [Hyaloscypha bicolor E]|uniref:Uncharacterized protein n=1 Tax=Hyaloscypha bicolor E TaxID=1095630 RepID=A0A2J6TVS9_9HELO|nr:uncharacterized protein K444DRAFT_606053 [Hyaloscypha bicolor E]PMD67107.1 hypothetical protein K444DRAFT_606053 [Hyaloscypha bicolor E]
MHATSSNEPAKEDFETQIQPRTLKRLPSHHPTIPHQTFLPNLNATSYPNCGLGRGRNSISPESTVGV